MDIGTLNFEIAGDNSKFLKSLDEAKKQAQKLQEDISPKSQKPNIDMSGVKQSVNSASEAVSNMASNTTSSFAKMSSEARRLASTLQWLQKQYDKLSDSGKSSTVGQSLKKNIDELQNKINSLNGDQAGEKISQGINKSNGFLKSHYDMLGNILKRAVIYTGIYSAGRLLVDLFTITGEFEKQKVALEGLLQNATAADKLFTEIKQFSVISPFNFKDLVTQAKELAAYSIPAQNIFGDLKKLGDVAAGTGSDMSRLILAFGEVNTQQVLSGRVLRQFTQAGVPLVDQLADHFSKLENKVVSTSDVFDMVSKKRVTFGDVDQVLDKLTSKGGMFYDMQERQADTLAGKISNLEDKFDIFLSELGESKRGLLNGVVDAASSMLQHWQATLKVIESIVIAVKEYKAAIFIINALAKRNYEIEIAQAALEKEKAGSAGTQTLEQGAATGLMAAGPTGAAITAGIVGLTLLSGAIDAYYEDRKAKQQEQFDQINTIEQETATNDDLMKKLQGLTSASKNDTAAMQERQDILDKIAQTEPTVSDEIANHADNLEHLKKVQKAYDAAQNVKKSFTFAVGEKDGLKEAESSYTDAINKRQQALAKLQTSYYEISNYVKEYVERGIDASNVHLVNKDDLKTIYSIITSTKDWKEQMKEIANLKPSDPFNMNNIFKSTNTETGNLFYPSNPYIDFKKSSVEAGQATFIYNAELDRTKGLLQSLAKENKLNLNTSEGRVAMEQLLKTYDGLKEETRNKLLISLGLSWSKDPYKQLTGWQKDLQNFLRKNNVPVIINVEDNMSDVINNIQTESKQLRERMANEKPILIKFGYAFSPAQDQKRVIENIKKDPRVPYFKKQILIQSYEDMAAYETENAGIKNVTSSLGIPEDHGTGKAKINKPKNTPAPKEDPIIKMYENEDNAIKNVRKTYEGLLKVMSRESAIDFLKKKKAFVGGATVSLLPDENDLNKNYEDWLTKIIPKASRNLGNSKKFNQQYIKDYITSLRNELNESNMNDVVTAAESKIKDIEDQLSQYKPQYNLYKQLVNITGDTQQAMNVAFGNDKAKSLIDFYRNKINEALSDDKQKINVDDLLGMSPSQLSKLKIPESIVSMKNELKNLMEEERSTNLLNLTNVVDQYASVESKIDTVRKKNDILRQSMKTISGLTDAQKQSIADAITAKENKEISDLQSQAFELTDVYKKLFGDVTNMSYRTMSDIVSEAKRFIEGAQEVTDPKTGKKQYQYDTGKRDSNNNEIFSTLSADNYTRVLKQITSLENNLGNINPFRKIKDGLDDIAKGAKQYKEAKDKATKQEGKDQEADGIKKIAEGFKNISDQASQAASSVASLFSTFGNDKASIAMEEISGIANGIGGIAQGIASKNPVAVLQGVVKVISSIAQAHDKKLDLAINKSKERVKELKNDYDDLERDIKRQLGEETNTQSSTLLSNYEQQLNELNTQLDDENSKKKKDQSAIADTEESIAELQDKIKYFYEDLAKEEYGIDMKDWASQISDSIVGAFENGENAAAAFDNTVASIMNNVIKSIISVNVVQPAIDNLRKYLFGDGTTKGVFSDSDLSASDIEGMIPYLTGMSSTISESQKLWDEISSAAESAGINISGTSSSSGITASEKSLTETTGNILAGYIDNIRFDTASQTLKMDQIIEYSKSSQVSFSNMLTELQKITSNTLIISNNTKYCESLYNFVVNKLATSGSGYALNVK